MDPSEKAPIGFVADQQGGHPPPQQMDPSALTGYPMTQQGGINPPPYEQQQMMMMQSQPQVVQPQMGQPQAIPAPQQTTNVTVQMAQQQQQTVVVEGSGPSSSTALIAAIFVSLLAFFCGCWWALFCSVAGIFLAMNDSGKQSLKCTSCAVIAIVVGVILGITIPIIVIFSSARAVSK